ncbi:hypothetical protein [Vibrio lentus]|uniref:GIY-YIG domain-containing protein n=1 Tax=Vibrio lentus TaxID=136468 RepID=A0A855IQC5_9VIBR|nr:hypothetical protein [Vibrio lentus]PMM58881.1 hypothetical protein BCT50_05480 [Vibrio lentus]
MSKIHIDWEGPFSLEKIKAMNGDTDYGVYQAYGKHVIYGNSVLLYIGQANYQTFGKRIPQHEKWGYMCDSNNLEFYVGKLGSNDAVSQVIWQEQIDIAEKLLIFAHTPAYNSSNINSLSGIPFDTTVYNWGNQRSLFPEVSAYRYFATYEDHFDTYRIFTCEE